MVAITFPDRETEKKALTFFIGRFSGSVLRSGVHIVSEASLEGLAGLKIPFTVQGIVTEEQRQKALRDAVMGCPPGPEGPG